MYNNVSEQFATTIRSPSRTFNLRLKINGKWIDAGFKKMSYETASTSDEGIQIGSAVAAKIELTVKRINELFENTEIPIEIGLKLPSGKYEYIPLGFFTAEHPTLDQATTTFTAYDRMMKTTGVYVSELTYPASAESVLKEISNGCGVPCNVSGLNGITIDTAPVGYTYREVIGYIASLAGGFACVDRTGTIVIKWYEDNGYTINESRIMTFEKNESDYHLDYLTCNVDSNTSFTSGIGTLGITFDNPLMTEEKLNSVHKKVRGFAYRGASLKTLGDIRLDPWDIVTVEESGETYKIPVMNITQEYDGGLAMTITAYGKTETETETDYKGPSAKLAERIYAEMMLTKELVAKKVDAEWVKANTVTAETIVSVNNELQNIKNNYLKSNEADIKFATIEEEKVIKSDIEQLNVKYEKVGILDGDVAGIKTLMFGSSTGESITTDFANSVVSMIGTAQIKDSMIDSLDAKKIKALDIDTTDVAVHSKDGLSRWSDNTIQISDSKRVRVQIGKDTSGDYNMYVWDAKGSLMFDALGLTEQGVQREIIRNDMVKEDANISAGKLDIGSLFNVINNDGTHTLKSNKIYLDDAAQTLNVLLQDIKTGSGKDYSEWGSLLKQSDDFITQKLWWTENIDGTSVKEKFSNVNQTLQEYSVSLSNMAKYDDEIYLISYVPTKDNYPAWDWCVPVYPSDTQFPREETWQYNDTEWDKYIGKIAYWENEGRAWRFIRNEDGSHGWKEIPNSETAYMLRQNSALRINLDSISSSLSLTQQDLKGNYSTTTQMNNAITQAITKESNSIKLEVSGTYATKNDINNLQIGGVNRFIKSTVTPNKYITATGIITDGGNYWDLTDYIDVSKWKNYVASGWTNLGNAPATCFYDSNKKFISGVADKSTGVRGSLPVPSNAVYMRFSFAHVDTNKLKIEKGTKATDYSPAPEDIDVKFNNYATTASLEAYIKKDPTTGELKSAIEAIADDITLNASGTINISGNKSVNINGNLFTLTSTNTTISADGSIDCKKLKAVNADLEGTLKNVNVTEEGITMTTTLIGGEYLMKSSTGAYLKIQGHFINLSNEDGTRNAVSIRRDGIYVDDYYYIRSGDAYYNLMDWIRHSETAGTVDISGNNCYIEGYYYIRHHGEWWKLEDYVKDIANN
uniref:Minor structural protein n=1 Tax=Siphoviridae sp. ctv2R2 TaxID=2823609 RepID=A0A8S5LAH6_9CAUD|nr:MAG TPA: Minor structural protein [Siphoviridae sp. ctv2R2]